MKNLFFISALFLNANAFATCWDFRDDPGKVCVNDKVMLLGNSPESLLKGPFKVISFEDDGVIVVRSIIPSGDPGRSVKAIKAIAEDDAIVLENRQFDSLVKIGDSVVRKSNSRVYEVIGLGAYGLIGIKVGSSSFLPLHKNEYTVLSK
jgi:hypothetical protein